MGACKTAIGRDRSKGCDRRLWIRGTFLLCQRSILSIQTGLGLSSAWRLPMDSTTLLIILIVLVLLGGGGYYGRGRWF